MSGAASPSPGSSDPADHSAWTPGDLSALGPAPWLVLGGGGLKGLCHIGVWQALVEAEVRPAGILGCSIGALVGYSLAAGRGWDEMAPLALALEKKDIVRVNRRVALFNGIRETGALRGDTLREYIEEVLPEGGWSSLRIPFQCNAVDLASAATVWFGAGARTDVDPVEAVYASAALPVIYPPARIGDDWFVDGGAGDSLPLARAEDLGATGIIAVDVGAAAADDPDEAVEQGLIGIHSRVFSIMAGNRRREKAAQWSGIPMLYIRPELEGYSTFAFEHVDYFLEEGYRVGRARLLEPTFTGGGVEAPAPRR